MNGEWFFSIILALITPFITALVGYYLGARRTLREYITSTVKDEYPLLLSEIKLRSKRFDNFLEKPDELAHNFPKLNEIIDKGIIGFIEKHHHDLFLSINFFEKNIAPKFKELYDHKNNSKKKILQSWTNYLEKNLPEEERRVSEDIASDLIYTINPLYVLPDFLNERHTEIQEKIWKCILKRASHIHQKKMKRRYVIRTEDTTDKNKIIRSLIETAKPEVENLLKSYKELKEQVDEQVKGKLIPLLQKYISKPL